MKWVLKIIQGLLGVAVSFCWAIAVIGLVLARHVENTKEVMTQVGKLGLYGLGLFLIIMAIELIAAKMKVNYE